MIKPVVLGTSFVDIKGFPEKEFVVHGRTAGRIVNIEGGVARNIAEDLAHMGAKPYFVSLVDESSAGEGLVNHLIDEGVDVSCVKATEDGMGIWMAIFDDKGEVYASISRRSKLMPLVDVLNEKGDEVFKDADALLIEIDVDEPVVRKAYELAEKYKLDIYVVISNIRVAMERIEYIKKAKCFICNAQETGVFFSTDTSENKAGREKMLEILKAGIRKLGLSSMVVTMDKRGGVYASLDGEEGLIDPAEVKVVDTTGAGDSFFAACSAKLIQGASLKEACEYATEIASKVIGSNSNVY